MSDQNIDRVVARSIAPYLEAGRRGLAAANWRLGMDANVLVSGIVIAVLAEVQRRVAGDLLDMPVTSGAGLMVVPVELLESLTDPDECDFDHHGGCQTHGYLSLEPGERCPQAEARELLAALPEEGGGHDG